VRACRGADRARQWPPASVTSFSHASYDATRPGHGRVVELRLDVRRHVEKLRRHVASEHVRLELLRQHRAPHVPTPSLLCGEPLPSGSRHLAPGKIAHLPFAALRELVEPQDLGEGFAGLRPSSREAPRNGKCAIFPGARCRRSPRGEALRRARLGVGTCGALC